jgi:hypothetical protein
MKFSTEVKKNKLIFTINEGQFKGVVYEYNTLDSNGINYNIINNKKSVNSNNKYLFENTINEILNKKLNK